MGRLCQDGQFWDNLVRACMSCQMRCTDPYQPAKCSEFCVEMDCRTDLGNYYDWLLRRCLPCTELCGRHPSECSHVCQAQPAALTREPVERAVLQAVGRPRSGAEHHAVIVYSLLGLCLAVLVCTIGLATLVMIRRAKYRKHAPANIGGGDAAGQDNHGSSKDRLVEPHRQVGERTSCPTETCIHCFPELRVPGCRHDRERPEQAPATPKLPQQAHAAGPSEDPAFEESHCCLQDVGPGAKDRGLRIICSPTQSSM